MKRILLISNCAISKSESNGRISSFAIKNEQPQILYNFYIRVCPNFDYCKYFSISPKKQYYRSYTLKGFQVNI